MVEYTYFTNTKYEKFIESLDWCDEDKNYYDVISFKNIPKDFNIPSTCKLYMYDCQTDYLFPKSRKIRIVYELEFKYFDVTLTKLRHHGSLRILRDLKTHENEFVRKMCDTAKNNIDWKKYDNNCTMIYIDLNVNQIENINFLMNKELYERIDLDLSFGVYNVDDIRNVYKKIDVEMIKFDNFYENIDIDSVINPETKKFNFELGKYTNYVLDLEFFSGKKVKTDSFKFFRKASYKNFENINEINNVAAKCYEILYKNYNGTKKGWYGYSEFDNYVFILKENDKYMFVHYCVDDASCGGYVFSLTTRIYNSLEQLWQELNDDIKCTILKNNLAVTKDNVMIVDDEPESKYESTSSESDN